LDERRKQGRELRIIFPSGAGTLKFTRLQVGIAITAVLGFMGHVGKTELDFMKCQTEIKALQRDNEQIHQMLRGLGIASKVGPVQQPEFEP
jgi:hypothetical protein